MGSGITAWAKVGMWPRFLGDFEGRIWSVGIEKLLEREGRGWDAHPSDPARP